MGATLKDLKDLVKRCKNMPDSTEIIVLNNYGAEIVNDINAGEICSGDLGSDDLDINNDNESKEYIIIYT